MFKKIALFCFLSTSLLYSHTQKKFNSQLDRFNKLKAITDALSAAFILESEKDYSETSIESIPPDAKAYEHLDAKEKEIQNMLFRIDKNLHKKARFLYSLADTTLIDRINASSTTPLPPPLIAIIEKCAQAIDELNQGL